MKVETPARQVDVGELVDADYQPGRRLLGVYGFVGDPPAVRSTCCAIPEYGIYSAIVENCELDTNLSPDGHSQTQARFRLRHEGDVLAGEAAAQGRFVVGRVGRSAPETAAARQQHADRRARRHVRRGRRRCRSSTRRTSRRWRCAARWPCPLPSCCCAEPKAEAVEVPLADLEWRLHLPAGYDVIDADGSVTPDDLKSPEPVAVQLAKKLYRWNDDLSCCRLLPAMQCAREAARRETAKSQLRQNGIALHNYGQANRIFPPQVVEASDTYGRPTADLSELDRAIAQKTAELNQKREELRRLAETAGSSRSEVLSVQQKLALEQLGLYRQELAKNRVALAASKDELDKNLAARAAAQSRGDTAEVNRLAAEAQRQQAIIRTLESQSRDTEGRARKVASEAETFGNTSVDVEGLRSDIRSRELSMANLRRQRANANVELEMLIQRNPVARQLQRELGLKGMEKAYNEGAVSKESGNGYASHYADERQRLQSQYEQRIRELQESTARNEGFVDSLKDVDKASVPLNDNVPLAYPNDEKAWKDLTMRRKENYSSMDLAKRPSSTPEAGKPLPSPHYASDDVSYAGAAYHIMPSSMRAKQYLSGARSLRINVLQSPKDTDRVLTFRSLGVNPELVVTLADRSRFSALGWGLALLVGVIGVAITRRPARRRAAYIVAVALLATIVPLVVGGIEVVVLCNMLFYAVCLLIPYYLVVNIVRMLVASCGRCCSSCAAKTAGRAAAAKSPAAVLIVAFAIGSAFAISIAKPQATLAANPESADGRYVIQVVEPTPPVKVPDDAIILPYDPDSTNGAKDANRVLVPYSRYVELWNRAHPDKKIETKAAPAPYALAGASYKTLLEGDDYLLVTGQLQIDVFSDGFVQIPLGLGGGVLAQAELDGKPARLSAASRRAGCEAASG